MASEEQLEDVARLLDRERILIDDHIGTTKPDEMAAIEASRRAVLAELARSEGAYAQLVDAPAEREQWQKVAALMADFHRTADSVVALSERNDDAEASAKWTTTRRDFAELRDGLGALIELNRDAALGSVDRIRAAEALVFRITDVIALCGFAGGAGVWLWMSRRITSYEDELRRREEELREQNRELDTFAGRVSHDLKNALAPLSLSASMLRRAAAEPARVQELAGRIDRVSRRADSVISALLTFSRASHDVHANESGSVRAAVQDVLEEVSPAAAARDVTIDTSDVDDVTVRCDGPLLHVVIANVVGNAIKYLDGCAVRHVRIAARADGAECRIDVGDTGPGIPASEQEKIFEPFYRIEGSRAAGTGIGLATVRRIVDARGGRVEVESSEGKGACFHLWLERAAKPT